MTLWPFRRSAPAPLLPTFPRTPMAGPSRSDLMMRLEYDADGPDVHVGYYRRDCRDAAAMIKDLRETIAEQASVIEELRARLQRFERVRGVAGRFVGRAAQ